MNKVKSRRIDYTKPGKPMSQKEFENMIAQCENGSFHSIETVKEEVEKWKVKYAEK